MIFVQHGNNNVFDILICYEIVYKILIIVTSQVHNKF